MINASGSPVSGGAGAEPLLEASAALDPLETTSQAAQVAEATELAFGNPDAEPFEHSGWSADRRRVYAAMCRTDQTAQRKHDFATCCSHVHVYQNPATGEVDWRAQTCHDRFCMTCGQRRSRRIAHALEIKMRESPNLFFVTLTVRGWREQNLALQLGRLAAGWAALRRLDGWKNYVRGGAIMTEVKWSTASGGHWHAHYHLICEARSIDERWLKSAWLMITGDSDQVKALEIDEPGKALSYVTKYASKPMDASFIRRPSLLDEAMKTLKARRLCALFGDWYGTPLKESEDADPTEVLTSWLYCGTVSDLSFRAERGDAEATRLLGQVERLRALRHALAIRCRGPDANGAATSTGAQ